MASWLTLHHTIPTFADPGKETFSKNCWKRRKCWLQAFSSCPIMFSTFPKTNLTSLVTFILSSANALNLDWSKVLSFGKELNGRFKSQNEKKLKTRLKFDRSLYLCPTFCQILTLKASIKTIVGFVLSLDEYQAVQMWSLICYLHCPRW